MLIFIIVTVITVILLARNEYKKEQRFEGVKPADTTVYRVIDLHRKDTKQFVGSDKEHKVNYIVKDKNKQISFPESSHPKNRYYIINMTFSPDIIQSINNKGHSGSALAGGLLAGPIGAAIGASRKRKTHVETTENFTNCYITLIDIGLEHSHSIVITCRSKEYNKLASGYMLNEIELKKLEAKIGQTNDGEPKVDSDSHKIKERLKRLKQLLYQELISKDDYDAKKKQILNIK